MKLSFHNHTNASWDCTSRLSDLEKVCLARGIDAITITDHNTIEGALKARNIFTKVKVIIGEEINTQSGEVVGLFLKKNIKPGMTLIQTLDEIHGQGGVAVVVHPFDRLRRHVIDPVALEKQAGDIDIVETFNSRTVFSSDDAKAKEWAVAQKKTMIVGNDAHTLGELGLSTVDLPDFSTAKEFLTSLESATFTTRRASLWVHGVTKFVKWTAPYRSGT